MLDNIVYSTELGGSYNLQEEQCKQDFYEERILLDEWIFSEPLSLEEDTVGARFTHVHVAKSRKVDAGCSEMYYDKEK